VWQFVVKSVRCAILCSRFLLRYNSIECDAYPRLEARGCMSGGRFARLDDLELIESCI